MDQLQGRPDRAYSPQRAFPDDRHSPARFEQLGPIPTITADVGFEFCQPELLSSGWGCRESAPGMSVPEAAIHEAHRLESTKHQVRFAEKISGNYSPILSMARPARAI